MGEKKSKIGSSLHTECTSNNALIENPTGTDESKSCIGHEWQCVPICFFNIQSLPATMNSQKILLEQMKVSTVGMHGNYCICKFCIQCIRDEPILPAKFLEKLDYESKEQNSGKIGGVSR